MKLILSVNDLEAGVYIHRFTKKQKEELFGLSEQKGLLPIDNSLPFNGGIVSVIQITGFNQGMVLDELRFKPFWNRCFRIVDAKTRALNGIVLETKSEQILFQPRSESSYRCTTHGNGVGSDADIASQRMLAHILKENKNDPCLVRLLKYVARLSPELATK